MPARPTRATRTRSARRPARAAAPVEGAAGGRERRASGARERNKRDKRLRIEGAARRLFERKGFEATTLREIAAAAGVAPGTLFLYAADKRDLLYRVFEAEARGRFAAGRAAAARQADLVEALMALFGAFLDFYAQHPALSGAILQELFLRPYEPDRLGALSREYVGHVADLVETARDAGRLRADVPVRTAASAFFAHYAWWVQAWLVARVVSRQEAASSLARALRLQIDGLRPEGPRPAPARGNRARAGSGRPVRPGRRKA